MRKLKKYKPTRFMAKTSHYDKDAADYAVMFIESLCHTKGTWAGKPFELIDWQEQIIRDLFGVLKPNATASSIQRISRSPRNRASRNLPPLWRSCSSAGMARNGPRCMDAPQTATRQRLCLMWRWICAVLPGAFQAGEDTGVPEENHLSAHQQLLPSAFGGCGEQARLQYPRCDL